jgi:hypothetical protein
MTSEVALTADLSTIVKEFAGSESRKEILKYLKSIVISIGIKFMSFSKFI